MYIGELPNDRLLTNGQAPMQSVQKIVTFSVLSGDGITQQHKTVSYKAFERVVLLLLVAAWLVGIVGGIILCWNVPQILQWIK
jgi:hypothetical protein